MPHAASGVDEYSQLRTEMTYRFVGLQQLLATSFIGFFTSAALILGLAFTAPGYRRQVLLGATPILLAMVSVVITLSLDWLRQIYRMGSYLVVFHERPAAESGDKLLGWISRNRAATPSGAEVLKHWLGDHGTIALAYAILGGLAWVPFLGEVFYFGRTLPSSSRVWLVLLLSVVESAWIGWRCRNLFATFPLLSGEFTRGWEMVRDQERGSAAKT